MQEEEAPLPDGLPFAVKAVHVTDDPMPLARARNEAARAASGDVLVFLDVDCVPSPSLVMAYTAALLEEDACLMGEVRYLAAGDTDGAGLADLLEAGRRHPSKPEPPEAGSAPEPDYGELWGLSFALRREAFWRTGGLDEAYVGYGAEETDFARRLEAAKVPLRRCGAALAFHQHHDVHVPPLHHFDHILRNAKLFKERWGEWPMDYWLGQFQERGFVVWYEDDIEVVRPPTPAEVEASKAPPGTLFS